MKERRDLSRETEECPPQTASPENMTHRAKLHAMRLLTARDYTEARLREKLAGAGYAPEAIDAAVSYVASFHYIDDARYARDFIRGRMERASRAKIRGELLQRGVDAEIIDEALEELYADELLAGEDPEFAQIRRLMEKKRFDAAAAPWEERQKFLAAAARRGFSPDKVRRVLEEEQREE